ncbi:hypothetical protein AHMF7605_04750 [Adhaeribacter arboris]|uniref:Outer membrane protein beta-barrel domain-containing protein n=1 Tax=Adhaeribacter arboris TaxID=2072846 RepID=A0A2T2YBJ0_9BACT|nr:outer membrane beta-barrel protein [Adhaeribacter arboris]PSR52882.1 hypothetical protein AHMF7605_04750 [Adhaeribacter arboris]
MQKTFTYLLWATFLLLVTNFNTFAQKNFTPGYLISSSQDTIAGLIDNKEWDRNPSYIDFKSNSESTIQHYTIQQLNGFGFVNGDVYRKAVVKIDKTPVRFEELLNNSKPTIVSDTVFLLEQVKGSLSLYHLLDEKDKSHFFIQKDEGLIDELIQRNFVFYKNSQPLFGTSEQYKDQLKYSYLHDFSDLYSQITKTSYTKAALTSLIQKANTRLNPEITKTIKIISKHESKFGLVVGVNLTHYQFISEGYEYLTKTHFTWQKNPMIGFSHQIILPRNRKKYAIYNELAWKRNFTQGQFDIKDATYSSTGIITIKANYLGLTSMLRYSWMNQKCQPFMNVGLAGNYATSVTTRVQASEQDRTNEQTTDKFILEHPGKFEGGIVVGGGVKVKQTTAEIRLEKGTGYLNPYTEIGARKTMLAFLVTYYFN